MRFSALPNCRSLNQVQQLLLQAALEQGEKATTAWQKWRDTVDIEHLDDESYHFLGLLYQNLVSHDVDDEHIARLKGIYRRTWYANQLLLNQARLVLQTWQENKIEAIVLQDVAVTPDYRDVAARPIYSLDFWVLPDQVKDAIQGLRSLGWLPASTDADQVLALRSVIEFQNQTQRLYLHQHIFWAIPQDYTDHQIWSHKVPMEVGDWATYRLDPTDQLLFICSRSKHRQEQRQLRWLVDAWMVLQTSAAAVEWGRLVAEAQRYQLVLPLTNLLIWLQETFAAEIPAWVLPSLNQMPVSYFELLEHRISPERKKLTRKARLVQVHHALARLKHQITSLFPLSSLHRGSRQSYAPKSIQ